VSIRSLSIIEVNILAKGAAIIKSSKIILHAVWFAGLGGSGQHGSGRGSPLLFWQTSRVREMNYRKDHLMLHATAPCFNPNKLPGSDIGSDGSGASS